MKQRSISLTTVWTVLRSLIPRSRYCISGSLSEYRTFFDSLSRNHGRRFAIGLLKEIRTAGLKVLLGIRPHRGFYKYSMWLKTYNDGFPRKLNKVHRLLISRKRVLNLIGISICSSYLVYELPPVKSIDAVINDFTGQRQGGGEEFQEWLRSFWPKFSKRWLRKVKPSQGLFSGFKAGPYGAPSFRYCFRDAYTLKSEFPETYKSVQKFLRAFSPDTYLSNNWASSVRGACSDFEEYFLTGFLSDGKDDLKSANPRGFSSFSVAEVKNPRLAKFAFLSEGGGKTRIITSCNYWIQQALYDYHNYIMGILGQLKTDFSFRQEESGLLLSHLTRNRKRRFYSFDMSGATDRFPRALQAFVVETISRGCGRAWYDIMGLPIWNSDTKSFHHFNVGQPMGVYSSWPVFALTHHFVVLFSAYKVGINPLYFRDYMILGDDVVIYNRKVARYYHWFLTVVLGVEISGHKSIISPNINLRCAEFAKRMFVNGLEVSPLTPKLLHAVRSSDPTQIRTIVDRVLVRWSITFTSQSEWIRDLFKRVIVSGRRNRVFSWFTKPGSTPEHLLEGLESVREEIWKHRSSLGDLKHIKVAETRHLDKSLSKIEVDMDGLSERLSRSLYFYPNGEDYLPPNLRRGYLSHPTATTAAEINSRISDARERRDRSVSSDLLVLSKWFNGFLKYKITPKFTLYEEKRRAEVLRDWKLASESRKAFNELFEAMMVITEHCEP